MGDSRPILDYAKPARPSPVIDLLRLMAAVLCFFTAIVGLGVIFWGVIAFLELPRAPTRDRPSYMFWGIVVCLVGLITMVFSVRWMFHAMRKKRQDSAIDPT